MYSPKQIADYFLSKHSADGNITPMKLIKLVYIAHGWHLGVTGNPLFENKVFALKYGTFIHKLYFAIRMFGSDSVDPYVFKLYSEKKPTEETKQFLDKIWNKYKEF